MRPTALLLLAGLTVAAMGCGGGASGRWERRTMPSHDRHRVFQAAREVLEEHFEIADANVVRGTIDTRPQVFERRREGTLADIRGAGGQWRRTVSARLERDGLDVVAAVAVRLEREATEAAVAMAEQHRTGPEEELPTVPERERLPGERPEEPVWMEVGYDENLARELLSLIAERVRKREGEDRMPGGPSPRDIAEETRRFGAAQGF